VLENVSIDQATWLAFLETFQLASEASPWLAAINLASFATMAMPHVAGILVSLAIQQSVKVAENYQSRKRYVLHAKFDSFQTRKYMHANVLIEIEQTPSSTA